MSKRNSVLVMNALLSADLCALLPFFTPASSLDDFREALAKRYACRENQVFLFGAARMGLFCLLEALHSNETDEVVLAGYTCLVVPNAVKFAGMQVRYADISADTLNIDLERLWPVVNQHTRAIVITHNFGITSEIIDAIRERHPGIFIIEDAAHTTGSTDVKGRSVGTLGDAAFFSFEYSKPITTGMGGALIVHASSVAEKVASTYEGISPYPLIDRWRIRLTIAALYLFGIRPLAPLKRIGMGVLRRLRLLYSTPGDECQGERPRRYPLAMDKAAANLGLRQFARLDSIEKKKRAICAAYATGLLGISGVRIWWEPRYDMVRFPLLLTTENAPEVLPRIRREITHETGIETGEWFNDVIHPKGCHRYGYHEGQCPVGEYVATRIFNLPVNISTPPDQVQIRRIRTVLLRHLSN